MRARSFFLLLAVILIQIAASDAALSKAGTSGKSTRNHSALGPQGIVSDSVVNFFSSSKTGKDLMEEKQNKEKKKPEQNQSVPVSSGQAASVVAPADRGTPGTVVAGSGKPVSHVRAQPITARNPPRAVIPPPVSRVSIPKIRQDIQRILEINKQIRSIQSVRALQFGRTQEQARVHQGVLDKAAAQPEAVPASSNSQASSKESILAQEKLRISHEEAQRNSALLEAVGNETATRTPGPVSGIEQPSQKH